MPAQPDTATRPCCPLAVCMVPVVGGGAPQPMQMVMMAPMMPAPMAPPMMPMMEFPTADGSSDAGAWINNNGTTMWPMMHPNMMFEPANLEAVPFWPEQGTAGRAELVNTTMDAVYWQPSLQQVPPQLPMEDVSKTPSPQSSPPITTREEVPQIELEAALPAVHQLISSSEEEEVPVQYRMESCVQAKTPPPAATFTDFIGACTSEAVGTETVTASCAGTLRRRRQKGGSLLWEPAAHCLGQVGPEAAGNESGVGTVCEEQAVEMHDENGEEAFAAMEAKAQEAASQLLSELRQGSNEQLVLANFERMSFQSKLTSRAAQLALEQASGVEKTILARGLKTHVRSAVQSKFANYVVQKITQVMPVSCANFIVEEMLGSGYEMARHRFGCRVFCRVLEHLTPNDVPTVTLVDEALEDPEDLCSHAYGSFVARHVLEFGLPQHKARIAAALRTNVLGFARDKLGSHVIEAAVRLAAHEDRRAIVDKLLSDEDQLFALSANQFGRHVVRSLVHQQGPQRQQVIHALKPLEDRLRTSRYGKSVVQALRSKGGSA